MERECISAEREEECYCAPGDEMMVIAMSAGGRGCDR